MCKVNRWFVVTIVMAAMILGVTQNAKATTLEVGPSGYPYTSIQAAIADALIGGDVILVHDGTYYEDINFMQKDITVRSENGPKVTIIDANQNDSVVVMSFLNGATLDGFTLTGGNKDTGGGGILVFNCDSSTKINNCIITGNTVDTGGGGIYLSGSSPLITNCTISGNVSVTVGGGIACSQSSPTIDNCIIFGNSSNQGGGIYSYGVSSSPSITKCTIKNNNAAIGAGIAFYTDSTGTIDNCSIFDNTATIHGGGVVFYHSSLSQIINSNINTNTAPNAGGIYLEMSSPTIKDCTINGNSATSTFASGGGIYCGYYSTPPIINCIISGNRATGQYGKGGGIYYTADSDSLTVNCTITGNLAMGSNGGGGGVYVYFSNPKMINCSVSGNSTEGEGGGIYYWGSSPTLVNSILWGNDAAGNPNEIYLNPTSSIAIDYSNIDPALITGPGTSVLTNTINSDPLFINPRPASEAPVIAGDYHLQVGSGCVNNGTGDTVTYPQLPSDDIDGDSRPRGTGYDIGADELNYIYSVCSSGCDYSSIQAAINAASNGDTVLVQDGTYMENIDFSGKSIKVRSVNGPDNTAIQASDTNNSVVTIGPDGGGSSSLDGFRISGATGAYAGGGLFIASSSPTVSNCIISGNTAFYGGGVSIQESSAVLENCTIVSNVATFGVSEELYGGQGGGVRVFAFNSTVYPVFSKCNITSNMAEFAGGGLHTSNAFDIAIKPVIVNCEITNNSVNNGYGGGIYFSDNTFYQNSVSLPRIINSTITRNRASDGGGGVNWGPYNTGSRLFMVNTILWDNLVGQLTESTSTSSLLIYGAYSGGGGYTGGMKLDLNNSDIHGIWPGTALIDADPSFVGGGDYHLKSDSLCIDSGTSDTAMFPDLPADDIDGDVRPQDLSHDMGSDEYCTDGDNDGYYAGSGCGTQIDCDDSDPDKYPGNPEVCDNKDNNCDDTIDGITQPTSCGVGECSGNTGQETCTAGSWGGDTCDPFAGATAEVCDNLDNNCDGSTDENLTQPTSCGVGGCSGNTGEETCSAGSWGGDTCDPFAGATAEVCDNLDNNCDGSTDEGLTQPTSCGVGECVGNTGEETCSAGSWGGDTCDPFAGATAEVCDNLDNNCDGSTDEGLTQPTSCGVGECAGNTGEETCLAGSWGGDTCDPFAGATAEVCDNLDNNCDGSTDEGLTQPTSCGVGECAGNTGQETCSAGSWGGDTCDPLAGATAEVCDSLDNNCDGNIDEGCPTCTDADGDGYYAEAGCGTEIDCNDSNPDINPGACDIKRNGIDEDCDGSDRRKGGACPPPGGGDPEICDDTIDNDGDGDVDCDDSDCSGDPACSGGCVPSPEICDDGIDNDCDGKTDCADKKDCRQDPAC